MTFVRLPARLVAGVKCGGVACPLAPGALGPRLGAPGESVVQGDKWRIPIALRVLSEVGFSESAPFFVEAMNEHEALLERLGIQ